MHDTQPELMAEPGFSEGTNTAKEWQDIQRMLKELN